ncbi:MAG: outer membrane protein assembly factor [Leptospira sp.]|nr:outer membrane protein assembly factor [Leptospira sp.]
MSYRHRRMKCKCLLYFSFFCFTGNATRIIAQVKEIPDTKLPFFLHANKKLDPSELAEKKEGWYFTGLPLFTSDPVRGQGAGIRGSLYFNGKKSDPLYEYQPYVYRISTQVYKSSEGVQNHFVSFDTPFIFNSPYRFKVSLGLDDNHHSQYFGIGEQSMKPLSYRDRGQPGGQLYRNANFSEKENSQKYRRPGQTVSEGPYASDQFYNQYWFESTTLATSIDKTFWGAFKWVFANEISKNVIRTYDGKISDAYDPVFGETKIKEINSILPTPNGTTKVTEDQNSGKIKGYHGGQINYFRVGFAYDTRDFEPDPDSGMLAEINFTNVSKATGSGFDYNKIFGQVKLFYMPFPKLFEELVIATRGGVSYTSNGAPFSEIR